MLYFRDAYVDMEPCSLVQYLFQLCNLSSKAFKRLRVKEEATEVAEERMALFMATRSILKEGLEVLGIKALEQM